MNDERLRELYGRGLAGRNEGRGTTTGCDVPPEALLALARGELREAERLELLDRVMASPRCQEEFALIRAVETAGRGLEEEESQDSGGTSSKNGVAFIRELRPVVVPFPVSPEVPVSRPAAAPAATPSATPRVRPLPRPMPWWRRNGVPVALAATALLAVGLSVGDRLGLPGGEVTRGDESGVSLIAPAPDGAAAAGTPLTFVWHPVSGAVRYQFELLGTDGTVVHETSTSDTVVALARPALDAGREYRWLVRAYDSVGTQRGTAVRPLRVRE